MTHPTWVLAPSSRAARANHHVSSPRGVFKSISLLYYITGLSVCSHYPTRSLAIHLVPNASIQSWCYFCPPLQIYEVLSWLFSADPSIEGCFPFFDPQCWEGFCLPALSFQTDRHVIECCHFWMCDVESNYFISQNLGLIRVLHLSVFVRIK